MRDAPQTDAKGPGEVQRIAILLLEDSRQDAELIREQLRQGGIDSRVDLVSDRPAFESALRSVRYDLVLADFSLPSFDGMTVLDTVRERAPDLPVILVSDVPGEETAVDSINRGAADYVLKQRLSRLPGAVARALAEARERAERRRAGEHLKLLVGELSHRVKNTLATVVSIARQTLRRSGSLEEFEKAFLGRVQVLAEVHDLLFEGDWSGADLGEIVLRTLKPFADRRKALVISGPSLRLVPRHAVTLSLVLHELAANAEKYGALGSEGGTVAIAWERRSAAGEERLHLIWRETGGPPVTPPAKKGFGTSLIERGVAYELDGETEMRFEPKGLVCRIGFPLE